MPLDVVYGESRDRTAAQALRQVVADGTVYLGYPVFATVKALGSEIEKLRRQLENALGQIIAEDRPTPAHVAISDEETPELPR